MDHSSLIFASVCRHFCSGFQAFVQYHSISSFYKKFFRYSVFKVQGKTPFI